MSFAERSGATLRRQLTRGRLATRQPFQLLRKLVETGVDLIQRAAGAGAFALKFAVAFLVGFLAGRVDVIAAPLLRLPIIAAVPGFPVVGALPRFPIFAAAPRFRLIAPRPRAARPLVVVLVVIIGE